jgi:RNA polymerase-binding transcription factor DksA
MDIQHYESTLLERRSYLNSKLHALEDALDEEPSKDVEERATEREGDEVMEGLGSTGLSEIRAIDAALTRIANGTFGECVRCGNEISAARLETVPHTALCRTCA